MKKILVIDDDEAVLDVMREALETFGYRVRTTDDTANIADLLKEYRPDMVLVDFILNGVNGGEICHQIKKDKRTAGLPVVLVSAYSRVILSLGHYGYDELLTKPFDLDRLIQTVEKYLPGEMVGN